MGRAYSCSGGVVVCVWLVRVDMFGLENMFGGIMRRDVTETKPRVLSVAARLLWKKLCAPRRKLYIILSFVFQDRTRLTAVLTYTSRGNRVLIKLFAGA